jgi:hypothetical protein
MRAGQRTTANGLPSLAMLKKELFNMVAGNLSAPDHRGNKIEIGPHLRRELIQDAVTLLWELQYATESRCGEIRTAIERLLDLIMGRHPT